MKNINKLETENIFKLIIKNALPAVIANIGWILYNIIDRIFVGKGLGTEALAGLSLTMPIFNFFISIGILVGVGSGILVGLKLGQKKYDYANKVITNLFILYFILSLLIMFFGYMYMNSILNFLGANKHTFFYAKTYISTLLPFVFFQFLTIGLNNIIRAEAHAKIAMLTILISSVLNICLDPIFIFILKMGVKGAAIATVISTITSSLWVLYHFTLSKKSVLKINFLNLNILPSLFSKLKFIKKSIKNSDIKLWLNLNFLSIDLDIMKKIIKLGLPVFLMQISSALIVLVFNRNLVYYGGNIAVAAMGIIDAVFVLVFMLLLGLRQGSQAVISYNYGAKNYKRVQQSLVYTLIMAFLIILPIFLLINIMPEKIVALFSKNDLELIVIATRGLKIFMSMTFFYGFSIIFNQYLQACGHGKEAIMLTLIRQLGILIPLIIILPKYFGGVQVIWYAAPISDIIGFVLSFLFFIKHMKILNNSY